MAKAYKNVNILDVVRSILVEHDNKCFRDPGYSDKIRIPVVQVTHDDANDGNIYIVITDDDRADKGDVYKISVEKLG